MHCDNRELYVIAFNDKFFDFALKNGNSLIVDYSYLSNGIDILNTDEIKLGDKKEKVEIKTIGELINTFEELIIAVRQKMDTQLYLGTIPLLPQFTLTPENNRELINQLVFDTLYDKYLRESPKLTRNEYCTNYINHDWNNSIYNAVNLEEYGITDETYLECYNFILDNFILDSLENDNYIIEKLKDIIDIKEDIQKLKDELSQIHKTKKLKDLLSQESNIKDIKNRIEEFEKYLEKYECNLGKYIQHIRGEIKKSIDKSNKMMEFKSKREAQIMNNPKLREEVKEFGFQPKSYIDYIILRNKRGKRVNKKAKYAWDYLYYNSNPDLITSKQFNRNFTKDSNTSYNTFVDNFNTYDTFVKSLISQDKDKDENKDYFLKSMDFYHLEIYKRLDFIYKLAVKMDEKDLTNIYKNYFLVRRFHPEVLCPYDREGLIGFSKKKEIL